MPRIRSIKPEFFRSKKLAACSPRARLTFIGLWIFSDDEGRYEYEPELLKADLWPWEPDVTPKETDACVAELVERGRLCMYEHGGKTYLHIVSWHEHQVISHKGKSRLPACHRETHGGPPEPSGGFQSTPEDSGGRQSDTGALQPDLGSRKGIRDLGKGSNPFIEQARPDSLIQAVFDTWVSSFPDATRRDLTPARRDAIAAALRRYPLEDVVDAARGWANDPWPERAQQNDLAQLLHMGSKRKPANVLEKMRDLWRRGPPQVMGRRTQEMANNAAGLHRALRAVEGGKRDG